MAPTSVTEQASLVGLMFYLSPTLTALVLAIVPPISLGAVSTELLIQVNRVSNPLLESRFFMVDI
jgi:hypothetical protein